MRLLICAGASGGGVYPALAVLQTLRGRLDDVLWAGSLGGMEADLVRREGIVYTEIPAAGIHGVGWRALPRNAIQLVNGYRASGGLLRSYKPDVLFFTGGYVAVPMAWAGRKLPTVLFVPDIEPGLALRSLARFADRIAVPVEESRSRFRSRAAVEATGYPVREELLAWIGRNSRQALGLEDGLPVLLVYGGSKGARSINRALIEALPRLLPEMQVVHISGTLDWPEVERRAKAVEPNLAGRYHPYDYLHGEMGAALAAADLVVARAGASVLGEFPAFGLPAVLVPYPHAWDYQHTNAAFLADRGGGVLLEDDHLSDKLAPTVLELIRDGRKRNAMRIATRDLFRPEAAAKIGELILATAGGRSESRKA